MNIYLTGMIISLAAYMLIATVISRRIRTMEDYYVAGRRAPVPLISGSLIASFTGVGMFMGDPAVCYEGVFSSIMLMATLQSSGYIIGAVFFGRYLRRSGVLTVAAFFEKRFCSRPLHILASVTSIIMMTVYLLSVMQGIGTMMSVVTGLSYNLCIALALIVFTFISVMSGSRGVLITDTVMSFVFLLATVLSILYIAGYTGGWFPSVQKIAADPALTDLLSWHGRPGVLYDSGAENVAWGLLYGVVWMSVCMVGPWQSSRYLMAKDEHVVIRSAFPAVICVFLLEFTACMMAVFVNLINPSLTDSSQVLIWTAMHVMPGLLGVLLLTGVLAAGISSATTFLSLIGTSVANDILYKKSENRILTGRIAMIVCALVVLGITITNPPAVFWVMYMGSSIVAASWLPVAIGAIASRRLTKAGAFAGMLTGFLVCFLLRLITGVVGANLPVWFEPSLAGMCCNTLAMVIVSLFTKPTAEEQAARTALFVAPPETGDAKAVRLTMRAAKISLLAGVVIALVLIAFWALPYLTAV
ncbi:MAG: sodium:solute symporter family protein [Lachnospiraceae bacterium]|nr:sodium:solute symporter family protein [Lachnospiraceae bacterium]